MDGWSCRWYYLTWFCEVEIIHREEAEAEYLMLLQAATIVNHYPNIFPALALMTFSRVSVSSVDCYRVSGSGYPDPASSRRGHCRI